MQYRSISDLHRAIVNGLHMLPRDIDLVVGIPRSGLLAANMLGLVANLPMTDLDSFVEGRVYSFGATKNTATFRGASDVRKVLVLDDSINTGGAMRQAKAKLLACESRAQFVFAAVYGLGDRVEGVDFIFEVVEQPRLFQWNFMHHGLLSKACVDIDGVLCLDPTEAENDDGPTYDSFLRNARALHKPTRFIAYLVTSRLEKYRSLTETWLRTNAIDYGKLVMLDLPTATERRRRGIHAGFKAAFYRQSDAEIFIESSLRQATEIASISNKPVLCTETHQMVLPTPLRSLFRMRIPFDAFAFLKRAQAMPEELRYTIADAQNRAKSRTLVTWLGPRPDGFVDAIESVRRICVAKNEYPIIVLSEFHQELMSQADTPVEFIPQVRHLPSLSAGQYQDYARRRHDLMLRKWAISREIPLGLGFEEFLAEQLS
ncbi:hypothetical protein ELI54_29060 (plasmid) [Rhizobium ruizarguesonis]|uniref:phosphoribosyltransferase family protein n=2 Tax=Rhizobium ruizarguesonis TaxID=2081791 RepID=UPI00102FAACB|nr:phosphoribosyltransferase family protein [Rhizobium ruizarguesonis]NEJ84989.1 hypothetical protein [Rhizobium ruizarguesonis]TAT71974.1 hypothetical protein ELI56_30270 [Rhizobium ruizarguesonis]TAT75628.1 hypothetical protein ELI54_29060 [Rhizobium ruizarguesonis]TAY30994.1 hypothetical protein ELH87_29580 [Rhizobium ruizarguesonis]TAY44824.1 hypothetical protein ELH88_27400 [Rhizobium ruizarguesonis]